MGTITGFGTVLLFILGGIGFLLITLLVGKFLRKSNPTEEKLTTYESGEEPTGSAWGRFNIRFYVIALVFLLFEAELVFLFPWSIVFGDQEIVNATNGLWPKFVFFEAVIFILVLAVGLVYVWANGMLDWARPKEKTVRFNGKIPLKVYEEFNERN